MKKTILIVCGLLLFSKNVHAQGNDIIVTCNNNGNCSMAPNPGAALFYESNMLPGDFVTKTFTVINQDKKEACNLRVKVFDDERSPNGTLFPSKLNAVILKNGMLFISNKTIQDLYTQQQIDLSTVPANGSVVYAWTVTFDLNSSNSFQNSSTEFKLSAAFSCDSPHRPKKDDHGWGGFPHWFDTVYQACYKAVTRLVSRR